MSAGAIAGIVLGVVGFIVVMKLCGYAANRLSGIPPRYESSPPSYGETQPSAPPYNPYYKGSFRHK